MQHTLIHSYLPSASRSHPLFVVVLYLSIALGAALAVSGCQGIRESTPVQGARYLSRDRQTLPEASEFLRQGDNAETPTTYRRVRSGTDASGHAYREETSVRMGTVRDPVITLPPAPDWGKYGVAVLGAATFIAGLVLLYNGWPKIGGSAAVGGALSMVIALTVDDWGWAYALAVLGTAAAAVWVLYSGYKSGLGEASAVARPPVSYPS